MVEGRGGKLGGGRGINIVGTIPLPSADARIVDEDTGCSSVIMFAIATKMVAGDNFHDVRTSSDCALLSHYEAVSEVEIFIEFLYNVPKRTCGLSRALVVVPRRLASKAQLAAKEYC